MKGDGFRLTAAMNFPNARQICLSDAQKSAFFRIFFDPVKSGL